MKEPIASIRIRRQEYDFNHNRWKPEEEIGGRYISFDEAKQYLLYGFIPCFIQDFRRLYNQNEEDFATTYFSKAINDNTISLMVTEYNRVVYKVVFSIVDTLAVD